MAKEYDDTNRGALFKNENKETDNHPDYKGNINVNGTDFWLSAWLKKSKDGMTFMSLSVQPKQEKPRAGSKPIAPDSDIPFN